MFLEIFLSYLVNDIKILSNDNFEPTQDHFLSEDDTI